MSDDCENTEYCQQSFKVLFQKLDRLDEAIRGNGKIGIMIRLDRLEQRARRQGKLIWLLLGAVATGLATALAMWIAG